MSSFAEIERKLAAARKERRDERALAARAEKIEDELEARMSPTDRQVRLLLSRSSQPETDDRPAEELTVDELQARALRGNTSR